MAYWLLSSARKTIIALAARHRLPAIYEDRQFVQDGGLISYGPSIAETTRPVGERLPLPSRTMKQVSVSSTDQGGGKRQSSAGMSGSAALATAAGASYRQSSRYLRQLPIPCSPSSSLWRQACRNSLHRAPL
jgi:hypothetical protein